MASTNNNYVPEELRNQILLSLPIKSLLRFKCVCKSWNKLISSKSFCYSHLAHNKSSSNTKRYLLIDHEDCYSAYLIKSESCFDVETSNHIGCYKPKLFETSIIHYGSCYLNVYGICNGLLCLSDGELCLTSTVYLWNPIARRGKKIPNPYEETHPTTNLHALAFGYHDNDYKVIKIARHGETYDVFIYSLTTDYWKFVRFIITDYNPLDPYYDNYMQYPNAMLLNGVAYFLKQEPCQVLCYDIIYEKIRTVNFSQHFKADSSFTLKAYGESIALLEYCQNGIYAGVVMWILSGQLMWEKRFSIDFKDSYPLGFIDGGKIILRTTYDPYKFMLFNLATSQFTELKFPQRFETLGERERICGIDSFVESLVLLDKSSMDEYIVKQSCCANISAFTLQRWKV